MWMWVQGVLLRREPSRLLAEPLASPLCPGGSGLRGSGHFRNRRGAPAHEKRRIPPAQALLQPRQPGAL